LVESNIVYTLSLKNKNRYLSLPLLGEGVSVTIKPQKAKENLQKGKDMYG